MSILIKRSHSSTEIKDSEPEAKRSKQYVGAAPKKYKGDSRYGPCDFFHFPDKHTWVVRCYNKFKPNNITKPMVFYNPESKSFIEDPAVMQALGDPIVDKKDPDLMRKIQRYTCMPRYSTHYFQAEALQSTEWLQFESEQQKEAVKGWLQESMYENDGAWFWVAWRDEKTALREACPSLIDDILDNVLAPMIWRDTAAWARWALFRTEALMVTPPSDGENHESCGYTGYWRAKPIVQHSGGRIRVDCARNPSFWAELYV
jgi:hypothetical protein